jgi:dTDP-4-dehydrorhamnose 3,5-epimerase
MDLGEERMTTTNVLTASQIVALETLPRDAQSVTRAGRPLVDFIDGVQLRTAITQVDERGTLCEMFNPAWGFDEIPLVYIYQISLLPGCVKGWALHLEQDDRLFFAAGRVRVVLFDGRTFSPTFQRLNRFEVGELNRGLLRIPAGVYHAVQNIGQTEAFFYNMPTKGYEHESPDKYRLPLDNDVIPYRFENVRGW